MRIWGDGWKYSIHNIQSSIFKEEIKDMSSQRVFDLDDRLVDFAAVVLDVVDLLPDTKAGSHVAGQLVRAGTSPASNYGEAQSAESRKDFIHKVKVALKELKESRVWLEVIWKKGMVADGELVDTTYVECEELIRILGKSAFTAQAISDREGGR